jgi:ketosteroid isomerase-like protein
MKIDNKTETEVMGVLNKFAEYYSKQDTKSLMSLFAADNDVVIYGTEPDEKCVSSNGVKMILDHNWSENESLSIEYNWTSISAVGSISWVAADACLKVNVEGRNFIFPSRLTSVLEKRGDEWLIVQGHFSFPTLRQPPEFF